MPTFPLDTGEDVRDKIDWEGGVWGALCWGLAAEDLPERYRDDWRSMAKLYNELDERATAFYDRLPPESDSDTEQEINAVVERAGSTHKIN